MSTTQRHRHPQPRCIGCRKTPEQIPEYLDLAEDLGVTPDEAVREEEGTYNRDNGHFTCTKCYTDMGSPSSVYGWIAP